MSPEIAHALELWRAYDLAVIEQKRADAVAAAVTGRPKRKGSRVVSPERLAEIDAAVEGGRARKAAEDAYVLARLVFDESRNEARSAGDVARASRPNRRPSGPAPPSDSARSAARCRGPERPAIVALDRSPENGVPPCSCGCPMCGRYALRQAGIEVLAEDFHIRAPAHPDLSPLTPRYNAAPMQVHPVVAVNRDGVRALRPMRWGFVPSWSKEKPKVRPINARDDTVATSGLFRAAFRRHRCLVPADGYYEWRAEGGPTKQPYLFEVDGGKVFAFAGLWDPWREAPDAEPALGYATITTTPNAVARQVHDRMPVILPEALWEQWLDPAFQDVDALRAMLQPLPDGALTIRAVNPAMGNVKFEGPACIGPPPPESTALASDAPLKPTRTRKPRAMKADAGEADLFTAN